MTTVTDTRKPEERLQDALLALRKSGGYVAWARMQSKIHTYSANNVAMIYSQCPHATKVASYNKWLDLDRCVRKGERGIAIIVPRTGKRVNRSGQEESYVWFGIGYVFDVSQTDGMPLPEAPKWKHGDNWASTVDTRLYDAMIEAGRHLGIAEWKHESKVGKPYAGLYRRSTHSVVICNDYPINYMVSVAAHEIAHHLTLPDLDGDIIATGTYSTADAEMLAEAAAFITLCHWGIEEEEYSARYVAYFSKAEGDKLKRLLHLSAKAAHRIIEAVEGILNGDQTQSTGEAA